MIIERGLYVHNVVTGFYLGAVTWLCRRYLINELTKITLEACAFFFLSPSFVLCVHDVLHFICLPVLVLRPMVWPLQEVGAGVQRGVQTAAWHTGEGGKDWCHPLLQCGPAFPDQGISHHQVVSLSVVVGTGVVTGVELGMWEWGWGTSVLPSALMWSSTLRSVSFPPSSCEFLWLWVWIQVQVQVWVWYVRVRMRKISAT